MLCSYNFLAQNLLIMMNFAVFVSRDWWARLRDSVLCRDDCSPEEPFPSFSLLRKDCPLLGARILAPVFETQTECGWYQGPPVVSSDFARAKGWCLNKIPSFGAASVFQPPALWVPGGQLRRTQQWNSLVPLHQVPWQEGAGDRLDCISPWCLESTEEQEILRVCGVSQAEPQGGLCVCLAFEERSESQPLNLSLPAGSSRHQR